MLALEALAGVVLNFEQSQASHFPIYQSLC